MRDLLAAALSNHYTLERELGRGGMASVWLARDLRLDRPVAIKVLHPELAGAIGIDRFLREIRLTARLQHPGIVPVLDSGTFAGPGGIELPWYAMGYVPGESLRARLDRERQLPVEEALRITSEVADALAAAHREGIVHRDIKPENLLLAGGRTWVADFGIARALVETGGDRLTSTGIAIGTPAYMSPEQASADAVDARTDQYSLATVLYEMLAGEPPFTGPTAHAILARRMAGPPRPIHPVRPSVPGEIEAALQCALALVPADRFAGVTEFARALSEGGRGSGTSWLVGARGSSAGRRVLRGASRESKAGLRWLGAAVVVAALAVTGWMIAGRRAEEPADAAPRDARAVALAEQGLRAFRRRTPAGAREAIEAYAAGIRIDSTYALAWAGLAEAYAQAYGRNFGFPGAARDSAVRLAVAAADRALFLNDRSAPAWVARGTVSRLVDPTDHGPALAAFRRAIAIDSTHPRAWFALGTSLAAAGDLGAALDSWRRAVAADPANAEALAFLGLGHYWRRQYDSAAAWADSALAVDPAYLLGRTTQGQVAVERGDYGRARAAFDAARRVTTDVETLNAIGGMALAEARRGAPAEADRLLQEAESLATAYVPVPQHSALYLAHAYAARGKAAAAIGWLARVSPRDDLHFQLHLRCDPPFDGLVSDPAFQALLREPRRPATAC